MRFIRKSKGQFFALYLVLLTLFMCGLVVFVYYSQSNILQANAVSPVNVLFLEDRYEIFKAQETAFFERSAREVNSDWEKGFENVLEDSYCNYFSKNVFSEFLFEDLYYLDRDQWDGAFDSVLEKEQFCKTIYSFDFGANGIIIFREELGKKDTWWAVERDTPNYPVYFEWKYTTKYLLKKEGLEYQVGEI